MSQVRDHSAELESAIDAAQFPVGVFWTTLNARCVRVNQAWCQLSGLSADESLEFGWTQAIHPDDRARVWREQAEHMLQKLNMNLEFRLLRPDGRVVWVLSQSVGILNADGELIGTMGTITDISARVAAEEARRESEQRFRNLVQLSPDLILLHERGIIVYINDAGIRLMAAESPNQLIGRHILDFVVPEHRERATLRMEDLRAGHAVDLTDMKIRRCDGEVIWIETIASLTTWKGGPVVQLVARDVTERRIAAESYRAVVENVRDPMWMMDRGADGLWRTSFVNASYIRQTGIPDAAWILGKTQTDLVADGITTADHAERAAARYEAAAAADRPVDFEYTLDWAGNQSYIQVTMSPVLDEDGHCNRIICLSRDLTSSRARERALAESEANYRAVVEGTSDAVWVMDKGHDGQFRMRLANARTEELLGTPIATMVGKTLHEWLPPQTATRAAARYRQAEAAGEPIEFEDLIERPGLPRAEVVTHLTPLYDAEATCYRIIGSARDVSERRRAESALLQAQKLESMGVLAGGIAHDFNNLLTTILGNMYLLEGELGPESPLLSYTHDARLASERGADLVRRLLGFSRPGAHARERVQLAQLLSETASLVQPALTSSVELVVEPGPEEDAAAGEFGALQQVLVNLLLNARDAMPGGGRISVSRRQCEIAPDTPFTQGGLDPGAYHEVTVTDTGSGMSRDVLQRIFDPFFTTKGIGKGTGLGLSTALSIVRSHRGWLEAESVEGEGSTFRMLLPIPPAG